GDFRVQQGGRLQLPGEQALQPAPRPAVVVDDDLVARQDFLQRLQRGEMAPGHDADAHGHAAQVRQPLAGRARPQIDAEARDSVHVGDEPAHAGARVTDAAPVARRVHGRQCLDKWAVLWPLLIRVSRVRADLMHDLLQKFRLQAFVLVIPFFQGDPFVESHEVWNNLDGGPFLRRHGSLLTARECESYLGIGDGPSTDVEATGRKRSFAGTMRDKMAQAGAQYCPTQRTASLRARVSKRVLVILVLGLLGACEQMGGLQGNRAKKAAREVQGLNGPVRSVSVADAVPVDKDGTWEPGEQKLASADTYDKQGNRTEHVVYRPDGTVDSKIVFTYDD